MHSLSILDFFSPFEIEIGFFHRFLEKYITYEKCQQHLEFPRSLLSWYYRGPT